MKSFFHTLRKLWRKRPRLRLLTSTEAAAIDSMRERGPQTFEYIGPVVVKHGWVYRAGKPSA